jgi:hypothetical protein
MNHFTSVPAEQRDELPPLHSITSSASASIVRGTSRPDAFASWSGADGLAISLP